MNSNCVIHERDYLEFLEDYKSFQGSQNGPMVAAKTWVVSACLLGKKCRYDGGDNFCQLAYELWQKGLALALCPECLGNLSTPRLPAEVRCGEVLRKDGVNVTQSFRLGVARAMELTRKVGATKALLKSRSPSCGFGQIYDGTFTRTTCEGHGLWTRSLLKERVQVFTEENTSNFV